ncbi:MAG: hypothetical protein ABIT37_07305 [Luteolibacter sp.]
MNRNWEVINRQGALLAAADEKKTEENGDRNSDQPEQDPTYFARGVFEQGAFRVCGVWIDFHSTICFASDMPVPGVLRKSLVLKCSGKWPVDYFGEIATIGQQDAPVRHANRTFATKLRSSVN